MERDLLILGGGPAGMAAGYHAKKNNISFSIIESSNKVGGNCKTLSMGQFKYDTGAHRFHDKDKAVTRLIRSILKDDLIKVSAPSRIIWKNKSVEFPLELTSIIRTVPFHLLVKISMENFLNSFRKISTFNNFREFAYYKYGKTLSELFLINYTEKLWGESADLLSKNVSGNRLKSFNYLSLLKSFSNYGRKNEEHIEGSFFYPRNGFGSIFDALYEIIGRKNILLEDPVINITLLKKDKYLVRTKSGKELISRKIICTLPPNIFMNIMEPAPSPHLLKITNNLKFRSLRLSIIALNKDKFSNNASLYFPEKIYPFSRIYEPKNRSKHLAPRNQTCIVVEVPCFSDDIIFKSKEEEFNDFVNKALFRSNFIKKEDIIDQKAYSMEYAYPQQLEKDNEFQKVISFTKALPNFITLGRNANFKYLHTHELFNQAEECIRRYNS